MNILIINSILYTAENHVIPKVQSIRDTMICNLAMGFVTLGHKVTIIAAEEYKPRSDEAFPFEILYLPSVFPRIFLPSVLPLHLKLIVFLRKNKASFDLIISSETFSFNSLFASRIAPGKTIIWQELGKHNNKFRRIPSKVWYNLIAPLWMKKVLIVPRSPIAGRFVSAFKLNVSDTHIGHPANVRMLTPKQEKEPFFVVISQLIPRKNILSIIKKFQAFLTKYPDCKYKLLIIGDGPYRKKIDEFIQKENLQSAVNLLGYLSHNKMNTYLSSSSCLLFDSLNELNAIVIGEAVATGTPVLTNTVPYNSREWVGKFDLGIAKNNWNEDDMYTIISNNAYYVSNCLKHRESLAPGYVAARFIEHSRKVNYENTNSQ